MAILLDYVQTIRHCSLIPYLQLARIRRVQVERAVLGRKSSSPRGLWAGMMAEMLGVQWFLLEADISSKMRPLRSGLSVLAVELMLENIQYTAKRSAWILRQLDVAILTTLGTAVRRSAWKVAAG